MAFYIDYYWTFLRVDYFDLSANVIFTMSTMPVILRSYDNYCYGKLIVTYLITTHNRVRYGLLIGNNYYTTVESERAFINSSVN